MNYRVLLIRLVTFLGGIYFFLKFVLPENIGEFRFGAYDEPISDGFVLVGAMALALGLINLLMVHGSKVVFRRRGWITSSALLIGLAAMLIVSGLDWTRGRGIAAAVQPIWTLRSFSERIVADHGAGVMPVGLLDGVRKPLAYYERNSILVRAVDAQVKLVEAKHSELSPLLTTLPAESTRRFAFARTLKELDEAITLVRTQNSRIQTALEESPDFSANTDLSAALSGLAVGYRGLLAAEYQQALVKRLYDFLFEGLYISLGAAMFSLLGFYIGAAAYRAFRVRSAESLLMMTAAFLVMLGQIPFGYWLWDGLPEVRLWLLQVPSAAAARAIELGAAVAGLVMAFRMWLSIESESFK